MYSSHFFTLSVSLCAFAAAASGQSGPPPPVSTSPTHTDTSETPQRLEDIIVTASPLERAPDEISAPTSVLAGIALNRHQQPTLGETLAGLPGIDSTYFGPGASRPVIRGLGGDRIRVLTGGLGTLDASVISPDHAVSLEPLLIERVEIVRGPATLLYGGGAIGGVVNVIDGRIPEILPAAPVSGRLEGRLNSSANERAGAGVLTGATGRLAWRLDGFRRTTNDVRIPGLAPAPEIASAMLAAGETPARGTLFNSATSTHGGAAGVSYIGAAGHVGVSYGGHASNYGVVAEPDVTIDLRQRRWDVHGEWLEPGGFLRVVRIDFGLADYQHDELEGPELGTRFENRGHEGRLEFLHEKLGPFEGALGFQDTRSDFAAIGDEAFMPPSLTRNKAVFLYEEIAGTHWTAQFGARVERQRITPESDGGLPTRRHSGETFTAGLIWRPDQNRSIALSLSANERAPNPQELYANGPHVGTNSFEIGDPELGVEQSRGVDLSFRQRRGSITGTVSVFLNRFDGYIFEQATGAERDGLPVFAFVQRNAEFYGGELETTFHLYESGENRADLRIIADTVRATDTTTGGPLPRTTPVRFGAGLEWTHGAWTFTADWRHVQSQRRVASRETFTGAYDLVSLGLTRRLEIGRTQTELFVRATNLFDVTARAHASFLKDIAPLPGRDVTAGLRLTF